MQSIRITTLAVALMALGGVTSADPARPTLDQIGATIHGFRLLRVEPVTEIDAQVRLFEHEKSGARLVYLSNSDDNKVFCVTFRTPPTDDSGVAHILEHSVFCGSRRFPVKDPFAELLKGSLQTFLNAFTANDRTYYPVASRNAVDFRNLMDVYLDAVFYPRLVQVPEIMMQEGWHYEVDAAGQLSYNGIVYNEMKGALSSPRQFLSLTIERNLFPQGTYGHSSGGDPAAIPTLTQAKLVAFHARYYHPSNAWMFIYGNGDVAAHLAFLDQQYLAHFERRTIDAAVIRQPAFDKPRQAVAEYSIGRDESTDDKTFLSVSYVAGSKPDADTHFGMELLSYMLLDSQAAPLRRALLSAEVGKDVESVWEGSLLQPYLSVVVKNSNPQMLPKFLATVDDTLRNLAEHGLDKQLIAAALNRLEFQLREADVPRMPQGLVIGMRLIDSWIYGGDPLLYLRYESVLRRIKEQAPHGYFEQLIRRQFLDNPNRAVVVLKPKKGLDTEQAEKLRKHMDELRAGMSPAELEAIKQAQAKLRTRQSTPDTSADLATIPCLTISDLSRVAEPLPVEKHTLAGGTVLYHPESTKGIAYLDLYFDAGAVSPELTPYVSLLAETLTKVDTARHNYQDLTSAIDIQTGGVALEVTPLADRVAPGVFHPRLALSAKSLLPQFPQMLELLDEVLLTSRFDDRARLKEIVQEARIQHEEAILEQGQIVASVRAASHLSPSYAYRDAASGLAYYRFLAALEKDFDARAAATIAQLRAVAKLIFRRSGLIVGATLSPGQFAAIQGPLGELLARLPDAPASAAPRPFAVAHVNEGVTIPSKVQYVAQAADYRAAGGTYSGHMLVLARLLTHGYLYDQVRVLNGAYGASFQAGRDGVLYFWSYRDPHLGRTLDTFRAVPAYLAKLEMSDRERIKAIIATIGRLDEPLRPQQKGELALRHYITRTTQALRQQERDEVLATTVGDLKALGPLLAKALAQNHICVLGGEEKLDGERKLFQSISGMAK